MGPVGPKTQFSIFYIIILLLLLFHFLLLLHTTATTPHLLRLHLHPHGHSRWTPTRPHFFSFTLPSSFPFLLQRHFQHTPHNTHTIISPSVIFLSFPFISFYFNFLLFSFLFFLSTQTYYTALFVSWLSTACWRYHIHTLPFPIFLPWSQKKEKRCKFILFYFIIIIIIFLTLILIIIVCESWVGDLIWNFGSFVDELIWNLCLVN